MHAIHAWGASAAGKALAPMTVQRREPGPNDVVIAIEFCGVCHSDIHHVRNDWGNEEYPVVS